MRKIYSINIGKKLNFYQNESDFKISNVSEYIYIYVSMCVCAHVNTHFINSLVSWGCRIH